MAASGPYLNLDWPGMHIKKSRSDPRFVEYVRSDATGRVWPSYGSDELIKSVAYADGAGTPTRDLDIKVGSRIYTVSDPEGEQRDQVRIEATADSSVMEWFGPSTNPAKREIRRQVYDAEAGELWVTNAIIVRPGQPDADSNVTVRVLASYPWGMELVRESVGADGDDPLVTEWDYYEDETDTNQYGRLFRVHYPDGGWVRYSYDERGRTTSVVQPVADASPTAGIDRCSATVYVYAGDPALAALNFPADDVEALNDTRPRLVVETILGHEVSRTYTAYLADQKVIKRCRVPGAAYDESSNLAEVITINGSGTFAGRRAVVAHEDGGFTRYTYSYNDTAKQLTTTIETGAGTETAVTSGVRRVTVEDAAGRDLSVSSIDIASGLTLSHQHYDRDVFGRVTNTTDVLRGTRTVREYGCCGMIRETAANGVVTETDYTDLRQVYASTRLGVTTAHDYDSWGNAAVTILSAPGVPAVRSANAYDPSGRLIAASNALGQVTRYGYAADPAGGRQVSITLPDGATRIETHYRDGRLRSVTGTAAAPEFHVYGADEEGTYSITYAGSDASAPEWVRTDTDMLGNERRVRYADGYEVTYAYDNYGRRVERDDGRVAALTAYDERGRAFRQAVDMNRNGIIDLAGDDRIGESVTRVANAYGTEVSITENRVYERAGDAAHTVASVNIAALDGSQAWTVSFGRTNHTRIARDPATVSRTETTTRPDGTRHIATYTNEQLVVEEAFSAAGERLSVRRRSYDALGRLAGLSESAANGETRLAAYQYDRLGNLTNESITVGAIERATLYRYDQRGRRVMTVLPDGGVVSNAYSPRGEMIEQSGSRTYPVRYAYNTQGRLASMSTFRGGFDAGADTTSWIYDDRRGWLSEKRYADGAAVTYDYYPDGALRTRRWARGVVTAYDYDPAGSLTNVTYSDGTPAVRYTRDRMGRPTRVVDGTGTNTFAYAADGRLVSVDGPAGRMDYAFDSFGRLTNMAARVAGGQSCLRGVCLRSRRPPCLGVGRHTRGSLCLWP